MNIGIVAGETSGDYLGAGLVHELLRYRPDAEFHGICGPRMQSLGLQSMFPMESISIMGVDDLLTSIRQILRTRRQLERFFLRNRPDVFVGIDVPDFNLGLEAKLRRHGIRTVHYVSPTVWAWRGYRIRKIRRAVDHMLTLFPFEADYYRRHNVPVTYVGHPIADEIDEHIDVGAARRRLGIDHAALVVALLPGSRVSELKRLGKIFIESANELKQRYPEAEIIAPMANEYTLRYFSGLVETWGRAQIRIVTGQAREVMTAADVVLLASGTAALEAALLRKPMVVAYRVSAFSSYLVRLFAHVKHFSMPNNLLDEPLVPEFMQDQATVTNLVNAVATYLDEPLSRAAVAARFLEIWRSLRCGANQRAAEAVLSVASGS